MNDVSITECSVVRGSVHKHGYGHKQATAAPSVAGVSEAGDCGSDVAARLVGIAGGAALRRERQPGFRLATALSGRFGGTSRASLAAGDGDAGSSGGDDTRVGAKMPLPGLSGAAAERYGATPSSAGCPMP